MKKRPELVDIDTAEFRLDDSLRSWLAEKFPTVDADATVELFRDKALAKGWVYASWPAAFRNYIRRGKEWGGVVYRSGLEDPAFGALIQHARAVGFRMPQKLETANGYRTALNEFDKRSTPRVLPFGAGLKRFGRE